MKNKSILCVPLDPVHDVGIKIIHRELQKHGYQSYLLPPDLPLEKILEKCLERDYDYILVSRTIGYGVAEVLARFIDLLDASGVREKAKVIIGGKAITPELATELGFDKGFDEHTSIEELISYLEGKTLDSIKTGLNRLKKDFVNTHTYNFFDSQIENLLELIAEKTLNWVQNKTTNATERSKIREEIINEYNPEKRNNLLKKYLQLCDKEIINFYEQGYFKSVRFVTEKERLDLRKFLDEHRHFNPLKIQINKSQPIIFKFLGSGCPIMDIVHGKICERWGANGFLIINPSWEARFEGLLDGLLSHENDGTITTLDNLLLFRKSFDHSTYLTIRAHRGLNTPETVLIGGNAEADFTKINLVYGSLGAGTDPYRLLVDGIEALRLSARFNMPFDIPGNDELSGVPAWKTLAGLLINLKLGLKLGAKPILKPLFCYGPHIRINGYMEQNYIDYNAAKIEVLKSIVDAPIWPGEPIAFMTQTEDRVQSSISTALHAALASTLKVDAITIASSDEAYSRGPISIASRIDTLQSVAETFKFYGSTNILFTGDFEIYKQMIYEKLRDVLISVSKRNNLAEAIMSGDLGNQEDGAYPGLFGRGTVVEKSS